MNYIELINNFWLFYDNTREKITVSDIVLYKILLRYCNRIGWVNPFTINPHIMLEINPLSINTYYKSLKHLNDLKLIVWNKGKHNKSNSQITILKINNSLTSSIDNQLVTNRNFNNSLVNSTVNSLVSSPEKNNKNLEKQENITDTNLNFTNSLVNSVVNSLVNNNKTNKTNNNIYNIYNIIKKFKENDFDFLINTKEFKQYLKKKNLKITKTKTEKNNFNFKNSLIELGIEKKIVEDWLLVRKNKKATNTETAFKAIKKEIELCELSANECIKTAVERNWSGFKSEWIDNLKVKTGEKRKAKIYDINPEIRKNPNRMQF